MACFFQTQLVGCPGRKLQAEGDVMVGEGWVIKALSHTAHVTDKGGSEGKELYRKGTSTMILVNSHWSVGGRVHY